ncbi:MAG: two pore domain potassium channel family protein [Bauldia sp.]|nr:two pore domain potassium channel family protein [Bauldia sp.]
MATPLAEAASAAPPSEIAGIPTAEALANPVVELALATLVLAIVVAIHGWSLGQVQKHFSSRFALYSPATPRWRVSTLTAVTIVLLVAIHLAETILWTVPLIYFQILDNFRDAYFYVLESYTTLGEATYSPPDQWRLVGPVIAISGLFTFGWTGSVLVYVMAQVGKLHAERSKAAALSRGPASGDRG